MENIFLNWLKARFLNCSVDSPQMLENLLNYYSNNACKFKVDENYIASVYDESNFVKSFKFDIDQTYIRSISLMST